MSRGEDIQAAYKQLRGTRIEMHEASEADLAARTALKQKEAALLLSGAIIGKNAETRDAQLKEGCKSELEAVEAARLAKAQSQLRYDLAALRVQELQWLIRADQAVASDLTEMGFL